MNRGMTCLTNCYRTVDGRKLKGHASMPPHVEISAIPAWAVIPTKQLPINLVATLPNFADNRPALVIRPMSRNNKGNSLA
jgi:hypothetical protein